MKISAFGSLMLIFTVIAIFFLPYSQPASSSCTDIIKISQHEKADYNILRQEVDIPAELPYYPDFDMDNVRSDFVCDVTANISSGYYSKPQTLMLSSKYDLYYTVDGSLPDINSLKYDPMSGIPINENTFICVRAEDNGRLSDVLFGSYVIFKNTESYKYAYGYNSLTNSEQYVYEKLYDAVSNFESVVDIGNLGISYSQLTKILFCVNYDNPMLFPDTQSSEYKSGTKENVTQAHLSYLYDKNECDFYRSKCEQKAEEIFAKADGSVSLMDYLSEVHTDILENAVYCDDDEDNSDIYEAFGVLVNGEGVCESYSRAFEYMCQKMGLDNLIVVGESEGVSHMWNMIKMDDEWYHIDLTWDDGNNGEVYYDFFNVDEITITTDGMREISPEIKEGEIETAKDVYNYYEIPFAAGVKYNYSNYYFGGETNIFN